VDAVSALLDELLELLENDTDRRARLRALMPEVPPPPARTEIYTVQSLAAELNVEQSRVHRAIRAGELAARKRGSYYVITADAVQAWAAALPRARADSARTGEQAVRRAFRSQRAQSHAAARREREGR
jgi:excisionase family DNA binding protein